MSESITLNTINRAHVDQLTKDKGEPEWLEKLRLKAFEHYMEADSPSTKSDDWRKTLVETLDLTSVSPLPASVSAKEPSDSKQFFEGRLKSIAGIIKHVGNSAVEQYLAPGLAEKGIVLTTLDECIKSKSELVKELFDSKDLSKETGKLSFMTAAFFASGAFLYVPKGVAVEQPFVIVNELPSDMTPGQITFPRIIVLADEGAHINVVNVFEGTGSAAASWDKAPKGKRKWIATSAIVDVIARPAASIHYLELYNFGSQVFSVARNNNNVGRDASIYALTAALGGGQLKSDIITTLQERGASADIRGVAFGDGEE
ncbi:MAG: SufD family Fe-S cluster assembly protein, partial [Candidatus Obscuribacterales bacterium]|nr:SufD family Fe-S cluster assembly protein [Candidatus Obscuribacterales bacterium]